MPTLNLTRDELMLLHDAFCYTMLDARVGEFLRSNPDKVERLRKKTKSLLTNEAIRAIQRVSDE